MIRAAGGAALRVVAAPQSFSGLSTGISNSVSSIMAGLGSTIQYTPVSSGKVLFILSGNPEDTSGVATLGTFGCRYGTGTAPARLASATGTTIATDITVNFVAANQIYGSLTWTTVLSLAAGTTYWFDVAWSGSTTGENRELVNIMCSIAELS